MSPSTPPPKVLQPGRNAPETLERVLYDVGQYAESWPSLSLPYWTFADRLLKARGQNLRGGFEHQWDRARDRTAAAFERYRQLEDDLAPEAEIEKAWINFQLHKSRRMVFDRLSHTTEFADLADLQALRDEPLEPYQPREIPAAAIVRHFLRRAPAIRRE
jgi:hypothetical protein